jgi:hypothetical protein
MHAVEKAEEEIGAMGNGGDGKWRRWEMGAMGNGGDGKWGRWEQGNGKGKAGDIDRQREERGLEGEIEREGERGMEGELGSERDKT